MRALVVILALLFASVASGNAQIGQTLSAQGEPGYVVNLDEGDGIGFYLVGPAAAYAGVGFTLGATFIGKLYACDDQTFDAATCVIVEQLTVTAPIKAAATARRYWILEVTAAETVGTPSQLVIKQTYSRVTSGSYVPPAPDTSTPPEPSVLSAVPGDALVNLAWPTSPAGNHDSWALDYSIGGADTWSVVTPEPGAFDVTAQQAGLTTGQLYDFRLADCNQVPTCSTYATASATPEAGLPEPGDPLWDTALWGDPNTPWGP
jgi:hypothetical protein